MSWANFEINDSSPTTRILGIEIRRDRYAKTLFLTQSRYVKRVLNRFGMNNSKTVSTPLAAHFKSLSSRNLRKIPYSNAVGSIMYAMVCFRPDVAYGVGWLVSRFLGIQVRSIGRLSNGWLDISRGQQIMELCLEKLTMPKVKF